MKQIILLTLSLFAYSWAQGQAIRTDFWMPDREVMGLHQDGDTLYIGGNFLNISRATTSAAPYKTFTKGVHSNYPVIIGSVRSIIPDGNGGWFLGGDITKAGDTFISGLVHLNPNFSVDAAFKPSITGGHITEMALAEGKLYIAGTFTQVDGQARP